MFKPGDGVSYCIGSDAYPCTVSRVSASGRTVWAKRDRFRGNGSNTFAESEKKGVFLLEPEAPEVKYTLRKDGHYRPAGRRAGYLSQGRHFRQDPHL